MEFVIVMKTEKGLQIGLNYYTEEQAKAKVTKMNKMGMKVSYMEVNQAYGLK